LAIESADLSIRKVAAIESLSRIGMARPEFLSSLSIEPNLWPTSALIDWLNILKRVNNILDSEERIKEAEHILRSRLNLQGTTMGFSTEGDDYLWWLMVSNDLNAVKLILSTLDSAGWREDMPRLVRGAIGRQRRGAWDLTIANAWGILAIEKFSLLFENIPISGKTFADLSKKRLSIDWDVQEKKDPLSFPWPSKKGETLSFIHEGSGKPWVTIQGLSAIPLKEPISSGYRIKKRLTSVEQKERGRWSRGDIVRVSLEIEAQADMTWVVVNDPIPAGATILGGGLGRNSALATRDERNKGWVWPAFEERSFDAFRSYYEYVPRGSFTVEYTLRLNQRGSFNLPETRVEALYSPEMFGEIPNEKFEVN
jgi:hypothetical protein